MTDDGPDNQILRQLRELDRKLDVVLERVDNLTSRVSSLESAVGLLVNHGATLNARMDSFDRRLKWMIELRLLHPEAP